MKKLFNSKQKEDSPPKLRKKDALSHSDAESADVKPIMKKQPKSKISTEYKMKKNTGMRVLRILLWTMITFIFVKGVLQIAKPDQSVKVNQLIQGFKDEQLNTGNGSDEIQCFAQDFVKEYLTYTYRGADDFKDRMKPYVTKRILSSVDGIYGFKNNVKATYVNAYRKEIYAENQWDVFVLAEVEYEVVNPETNELELTTEQSNLKVPVVYVPGSGFCIESLPLFVQDKRLNDNYNPSEMIVGSEISTDTLKPAIENFLEAYYSGEQQMINYLLSADADKEKFRGMDKRFVFSSITSVKAYELDGGNILCVVKTKVRDGVNEEELGQELNLTVIQEKDKVYIKDMDARVVSIK